MAAEGNDMKLQINGQQLRLRIDEDELGQLRGGSTLSGITYLPGASVFEWLMQFHGGDGAELSVDDGRWRIALPIAAVDAYVERLPCKEGLDFALPTVGGKTLDLVFEVDVRDSVRRRGVRSRRE